MMYTGLCTPFVLRGREGPLKLFQLGLFNSRVRNVDIIYDYEAKHSISDVPKHSSNRGLNPRNFSFPGGVQNHINVKDKS